MVKHKDTKAQRHQESRRTKHFMPAFLVSLCLTTEDPAETVMLSHEENTLLTQTNAGTPMGGYFRRYWLPAMLAAELPAPDCPPVRVRLLGENLIAFRDTNG